MAIHSKSYVINSMQDSYFIPLFYEADTDKACQIAEACYQGGARILEFTQRGPGALQVFGALAKFCRQHLDGMVLGAGSIAAASAADEFAAAGANFIVSPFFRAEIAEYCNGQDLPYFPGCATATEIVNAEDYGVEVCKIFPAAQVGGPGFIKALRAPMPWTKLMPTGGVKNTLEDLKAWHDAGAYCVGMGSTLLENDLIKNSDFAGLQKSVEKACEFVRKIKN